MHTISMPMHTCSPADSTLQVSTMSYLDNDQEFCHYRGAIALNNIGVTLIERQCYEEAAQTLRDSLATMRSMHWIAAAKVEPMKACEQSPVMMAGHDFTVDLRAKLARACSLQNVTRCQPLSDPARRCFTQSQSDSDLFIGCSILDAMKLSSNQLLCSSAARKSDTNDIVVFPIRMVGDETFYDTLPNTLRGDLQMAIALHNLGLAHVALAHSSSKGQTDEQSACLRSVAVRLFQLGYSTMLHHVLILNDDQDNSQHPCLVLMVMLLYDVLVVGLGRDEFATEVSDAYWTLQRLESAISNLDVFGALDLNLQPRPAAAA